MSTEPPGYKQAGGITAKVFQKEIKVVGVPADKAVELYSSRMGKLLTHLEEASRRIMFYHSQKEV